AIIQSSSRTHSQFEVRIRDCRGAPRRASAMPRIDAACTTSKSLNGQVPATQSRRRRHHKSSIGRTAVTGLRIEHRWRRTHNGREEHVMDLLAPLILSLTMSAQGAVPVDAQALTQLKAVVATLERVERGQRT